MAKPTLQEIANMPPSAARAAMREHYDRNWGEVQEEPEDGEHKFKVRVQYTRYIETSDEETFIVAALHEIDAKEIAIERLERHFEDWSSVEIDDVIAEEI